LIHIKKSSRTGNKWKDIPEFNRVVVIRRMTLLGEEGIDRVLFSIVKEIQSGGDGIASITAAPVERVNWKELTLFGILG
jgi:hypothetical protein